MKCCLSTFRSTTRWRGGGGGGVEAKILFCVGVVHNMYHISDDVKPLETLSPENRSNMTNTHFHAFCCHISDSPTSSRFDEASGK